LSGVALHVGDCLDVMRGMADDSVDAIVTDPPYGLAFMGKKWDYDVPSEAIWRECLRVLKPGGHLLAFAGTRTQHRMAVRIEDAGFDIRDMLAWVYGSGFPKSLDVSKAIDKARGAERDVVGSRSVSVDQWTAKGREAFARGESAALVDITAPATDEAKQWQGWGTALKPALEPITMARKPFKGTVAANVLEHGTGGLNVDGCRVETHGVDRPLRQNTGRTGNIYGAGLHGSMSIGTTTEGRWPANLIHDGSQEVLDLFPASTSGSAARFFYCAKASKADRGVDNKHPTVKPTDLMRYLCRLVTPPGGVVLDPFMGSGSTGKAATLEGFDFIGIDLDAEYVAIARGRIEGLRP
jgi:DNA modification methylase